jgi:Tol biopolymer transport system component
VRFDRILAAAVLGLGLTVGALSIASARLGPAVDSLTTARVLVGTSINSQIGLTFTEAMNRRSVERAFHLSPRVSGDFVWSGNELVFTPQRPLGYDTQYSLTVDSTASGASGKRLFRAYRSSFRTQSEHLLYRGTKGAQRNRLILASLDGKHQVIGANDGLVTDFALSFDRSLAVYVKRGARGERPNQIWVVSLTDGSEQRVFRRPDWNIAQPHFSPDGKSIVFLATNVRVCQRYYGCFRDRSGPIIYLLDLGTHQVKPFHANGDVPITNFIDFSPAGQLAYTDLGSALTLASPDGSRVIHIPNENNSLEYVGFDARGDKAAFVGQTPSSSGGDVLIYDRGKYLDVSYGIYDSSTPSFATSGRQVAYAAYRGEQGIEPLYGINVYDFATHTTRRLTGERSWSDWNPQWSTDDRYIAFVRSRPQEAMYMGAGQVWAMRSDGKGARQLGVGSDPVWAS